VAPRISQGTAASKTAAGRRSSSSAPTRPPTSETRASGAIQPRTSSNRRRKAHTEPGMPNHRATVEVVLARTGGSPAASSAGKVSMVPPPAIAFIAPAKKPAARTIQSITDGTPAFDALRDRAGADVVVTGHRFKRFENTGEGVSAVFETADGPVTFDADILIGADGFHSAVRRQLHPNEGPAQAEGMLQGALKSLFAVSEAYPQLLASNNFLELQRELTDTEDKIMASRRFFNGGVRELNTKIQQFPNNVFANSLGFAEREFFEVDNLQAIQEPPKAQF